MLTTLALAPAAFILFYNIASQRIERQHEIRAEALRTGQLATLEVQRIISGLENVLMAVAAAPVIQRFDAAGCAEYVGRLGKSLHQFASLGVVDAAGIARCRQDSQGLGVSVADRGYFKKAVETRSFVVGNYVIGKVTGKPVLPLALPVLGEAGEITGVVVGSIDLQWLDARLKERSFARDSALTIADESGTIVARQPYSEQFVGTRIPDSFMPLVTGDHAGVEEVVSQDGTRRVIGYYPPSVSGSGLYISSGISTDDFYAAINRSTYVSLAITVLGLVAAYVLAWATSRQFVGLPVERLVQTIRLWQQNRTDTRTGMGERDGELGLVGAAIDQYMDELVASRAERRQAEQQRELMVRELDHRVKNLLATVQAVARQSFHKSPDVNQALDLFTSRLAAMGDAHQLLMSNDWQAASIHGLVKTAIRPFDNPGESQFDVSGPDLLLNPKAALALGMALHEMCTNASKYGALSQLSGRIRIEWKDERGNGQPTFLFRWSESGGPPVSPPARQGFGSLMIQRVLASDMKADVKIDYRESGIEYRLSTPLANIAAADPVFPEKPLQLSA